MYTAFAIYVSSTTSVGFSCIIVYELVKDIL